MSDRPEQPVYRIAIAFSPDPVPGIMRLRRFLKMAWRGYKLKAVKVEELPPEGSAPEAVNNPADRNESPGG
jgi:hypothetical protein